MHNNKPVESEKKTIVSRETLRTIATYGGVLLFLGAVLYYIFFANYSFINPYYYSKKAGSTKDNFLIRFPETATAKHLSFEQDLSQDNGLQYVNEYVASDFTGIDKQQYYVNAAQYDQSITNFANYSSIELTNFLTKDIEYRASLVSGETVDSTRSIQFQNITAVRASITCGKSSCYEIDFADVQNNKTYIILEANTSQALFNKFANTFKYSALR
jgi:hypothetical protein